MSWGRGIFIFLVVFVVANLVFLFITSKWDWSLVDDDYYPKELKHEELLVKKRNYNALGEKMTMSLTDSSVNIRYPRDFQNRDASGTIQVYRPSNKTLDHHIPVRFDTTMVQSIARSRFSHGNYFIKVDWSVAGINYYHEQEIFIP
jgi:hypothetical protein